jgi:hypothetical protein
MGNYSGPKGPTYEESRELHKGYWDTYNTWNQNIIASRDKEMSSTRTKFSIAGVNEDDPMYTSRVGAIEADYEKQLKEIQKGPTAGLLKDYYVQQKGAQLAALEPNYVIDAGGEAEGGSADGMKIVMQNWAQEEVNRASKWNRKELESATMEEWYAREFAGEGGGGEQRAARQAARKQRKADAATARTDRKERRATDKAREPSPWW